MIRLKFKNSCPRYTDLNNPFYMCILDNNTEYLVTSETEDDYYFTSGGNSKHIVRKTDPDLIVLTTKTPRLVYVLFEYGEETSEYYLNIQSIPYRNPDIFPEHEYKLMWKLV